MTTKEKKNLFIEAYSFDRLTYDEFSLKYDIERAEVPILYDKTRTKTLEIQKIRDKYTSLLNRSKSDFIDFKDFYIWFTTQSNKCCYCGIKQKDLKQLFNKGKLQSKKFNGTLHIERFDSNKPYSSKNCGLACAICNNAKSDFISKEDFVEFFAPAIKQFFKKKMEEL
jgi:hypothetical protein